MIYFRSNLGPFNISNKPLRMFQTVPDTSSYVKVRHDSIFKQVMSKIPILPNSRSFVLVENLIPFLTEFSRRKIPSTSVGEGAEAEISNLSFWKCAGLSKKLSHWGQTMGSGGLVFSPASVLGLLGYPIVRVS